MSRILNPSGQEVASGDNYTPDFCIVPMGLVNKITNELKHTFSVAVEMQKLLLYTQYPRIYKEVLTEFAVHHYANVVNGVDLADPENAEQYNEQRAELEGKYLVRPLQNPIPCDQLFEDQTDVADILKSVGERQKEVGSEVVDDG